MTVTVGNTFKLNIQVEAWQPPYPVPASQGEVTIIGGDAFPPPSEWALPIDGDANHTICGGGSQFPTNVWADVRPSEIGTIGHANFALYGDAGPTFVESYSQGGAIVIAGAGGHSATNLFGAALFDFEDARWKRIWTTGGAPGSDNIAGVPADPEAPGPDPQDVRTGTRVHNLLNYEDDQYGDPAANHAASPPCYNSDHWVANQGLPWVVKTANPWDQTWEITRVEPTAYDATTQPHGWLYPGQWANLQQSVTGKDHSGLMGRSGRYDPIGACPAPGHTWDMNFEVSPANGGGTRGSFAFSTSRNQAHSGQSFLLYSYRFDLHTGVWHQFSTNSVPRTSPPVGVPGSSTPQPMDGQDAGCYDPIGNRQFRLSVSGSGVTRGNYMNLSEGVWRNFSTGSHTGASGMNQIKAASVDPVRRLIIVSCDGTGSTTKIRCLNIAAMDSQGANPTAAAGGYQLPNLTILPGHPTWSAANNYRWNYCPGDGKYYRLVIRPAGISGSPPTRDQYEAYGDFTMTYLQRITPPPIVTPFPATTDYYIDQPWTYDTIPLDTPIPRPDYGVMYQAIGAIWMYWIPALECFAYCPLDGGISSSTNGWHSRRSVYLIKPY